MTQPSGAELRAALDRSLRESSALSVLLSQAVAERVGLNPTDLESLDLLFLHGPMTAGRLAELTGLTTGAVTGIVDRLERAGYARRDADPSDRRRVIVRLDGDKAEREIAPLYEAMAQRMDDLYAGYSDAELALILDFFRRAQDLAMDRVATLRAEAAAAKRRDH